MQSPEELVLTITDMDRRHAPMATILTVAARALRAERERAAQVADALAKEGRTASAWVSEWTDYSTIKAAEHIAVAIRALT